MMKVHVLQHVPFEGLGNRADRLVAHGATVTWSRLHASAALPKQTDYDLPIALGGPMSVNDEAVHPWLAARSVYRDDIIVALRRQTLRTKGSTTR